MDKIIISTIEKLRVCKNLHVNLSGDNQIIITGKSFRKLEKEPARIKFIVSVSGAPGPMYVLRGIKPVVIVDCFVNDQRAFGNLDVPAEDYKYLAKEIEGITEAAKKSEKFTEEDAYNFLNQ